MRKLTEEEQKKFEGQLKKAFELIEDVGGFPIAIVFTKDDTDGVLVLSKNEKIIDKAKTACVNFVLGNGEITIIPKDITKDLGL